MRLCARFDPLIDRSFFQVKSFIFPIFAELSDDILIGSARLSNLRRELDSHVFPKPKLSIGDMKDENPRTVAGYAWGMYGFLIMLNCTYYADYVYRHYTVDKYGYLGLATRTIYGMSNFFRTALHFIVWFIAGLLWALTFTQLPAFWVMFKHYAMFLAVFELCRVALVIILNIFALFLDNFDDLGDGWGMTIIKLNVFKEQFAMGNRQLGAGKELRFIKSWDYKMEMLNISLMFIAYPLFTFGVEGSWQQMEDQWSMPSVHKSQPESHSILKPHETDEVNEAKETRERAAREAGKKQREINDNDDKRVDDLNNF